MTARDVEDDGVSRLGARHGAPVRRVRALHTGIRHRVGEQRPLIGCRSRKRVRIESVEGIEIDPLQTVPRLKGVLEGVLGGRGVEVVERGLDRVNLIAGLSEMLCEPSAHDVVNTHARLVRRTRTR